MRKSILIAGVVLASLFATVAGAKTVLVSLTQQQVANVCGKDMASGGGHSGCTKSCGNYVCDYDCSKGKCQGQCVTCPGQSRVIPNLRARATISGAVLAPSP